MSQTAASAHTVVAVDEIIGWGVAGTVTLVGVLVAGYLGERSRKQSAHFNTIKALALAPLASWIANVAPLPKLVTLAEFGFEATAEPFTALDLPQVTCVRRVHYPALVEEWTILDLNYRVFVRDVLVWARMVENRVNVIVGGGRIKSYRDSEQFPGYSESLVTELLQGLVGKPLRIPLLTEKWSLGPASLDGERDAGKQYLWVTVRGTTIVNLALPVGEDRDELVAVVRTKIAELSEDPPLVTQTGELVTRGNQLRQRMTSFKTKLAKILDVDLTLPGTCDSVEPCWYFRLFTIVKRRA